MNVDVNVEHEMMTFLATPVNQFRRYCCLSVQDRGREGLMVLRANVKPLKQSPLNYQIKTKIMPKGNEIMISFGISTPYPYSKETLS